MALDVFQTAMGTRVLYPGLQFCKTQNFEFTIVSFCHGGIEEEGFWRIKEKWEEGKGGGRCRKKN